MTDKEKKRRTIKGRIDREGYQAVKEGIEEVKKHSEWKWMLDEALEGHREYVDGLKLQIKERGEIIKMLEEAR